MKNNVLTFLLNLSYNHVDHNESPSTAYASTAMHYNWSGIEHGFLTSVDIVKETENTAWIGRDTMIRPSLQERHGIKFKTILLMIH